MFIKITRRMEKQKKIDVAIKDTQMRIKSVEEGIMLLIREKETLREQLDMLEIIRDDKNLE